MTAKPRPSLPPASPPRPAAPSTPPPPAGPKSADACIRDLVAAAPPLSDEARSRLAFHFRRRESATAHHSRAA